MNSTWIFQFSVTLLFCTSPFLDVIFVRFFVGLNLIRKTAGMSQLSYITCAFVAAVLYLHLRVLSFARISFVPKYISLTSDHIYCFLFICSNIIEISYSLLPTFMAANLQLVLLMDSSDSLIFVHQRCKN